MTGARSRLRRDSLADLAPTPVGRGARFLYVAPELRPCEVVIMPGECYRLRRADGFWSQGFPSPHALEWHVKNGTALDFTRPQSSRTSAALHSAEVPPNAERARAPKPLTVARADVETPARVIIAAARRLDATIDADAIAAYREFFEVFDIAIGDLARAVES